MNRRPQLLLIEDDANLADVMANYLRDINGILERRRQPRAAVAGDHHPERTYSRDEILKVVFSPTDTPGTVDTYVHYLRQKTEQSAIVTVRRRGYRLGVL